ncbi:MAG: F0F1 ATP synthase subunit B [Phycisphaerales bacterium]|nr:F0F1 ATP synthase subunit B [Phycisphaerales bacterium]
MTRKVMRLAVCAAFLATSMATLAQHDPHATDAAQQSHTADAGAGSAHGSQPNIFAGDLGNVIWTTVTFALVVIILGRFAWPALVSGLAQRERTIRESLEHARVERQKAEALLRDYTAKIERARVEATAIVDEGKRDAEAVRRRIQEETRKEADETIARAKREIQLAKDSAVKDLYDQTAELAVRVAGGIIRKELRADDHRGLVAESLQRISSSRN